MESMGDLVSALDSSPAISAGDPSAASKGSATSDAARISEVRSWLAAQFEAAGREVPAFDYTPRVVSHLHAMATLSTARSRADAIVAADLRLKASEYRAQAARIREVLDAAGLSHERLTPVALNAAQDLACVANLLNIRDTELSSFVVAMAELSLRKADVEEKRAKVQKESKVLLEYTRKAIAKLNDLKKTLVKFENEVPLHDAQMLQWQTNLAIMDSKERQYNLQHANYKALLKRVGYTPEINHGVLMEMAEHRKDLEKKTKPILDTLRSYQDLPPDKALAALAIEEKKRQYAAAEKYLEDVLHSALTTPEI
ncbi:AUGMIN subunit 1 isoform X1 [Dioscorea cayenensis subsp. rotundata]|uniref:AUGMIN subunit 1 isoform X1 n=1 Tax=Dioscorea cayennensis subsp. rotundata TaxID=55577 RepID=A0AB40CPF7_DIOCR|nr:AUGMIN subunit 1 isoform X1 [Dioscorea cayenensis subsp. rotundata]